MVGLPQLAERFVRIVRSAPFVLLGTHLNPDGDALGSSLGLSLALDQIGVRSQVVCNNLAPYNLQWMPGLDRLALEPSESTDVGIVLDLDALHRLGRTEPHFSGLRELVLIDHHVPHEEPGTLRLVDTTSPATALLVFRLIKALDLDLTRDIATCLLTGIVTDTGSFRYRNTTAESLHASAELVAAGGEIVRVGEEVYQKRPIASVRLMGRTLNHLKLSDDGRLAWAVVGPEDFAAAGAEEVHTEGLVNELLAINTVQIAAVIRQPSHDKKVRASVRSRDPFDVASAVRPFGGGGHRNAAGVTFETSITEAEESLMEALRRCLAS